MTPPTRPDLAGMLAQLAGYPDNYHHVINVTWVRATIAWALHLEQLIAPSHRHTLIPRGEHTLCYELSAGTHLMWVSWHRGSTCVKGTVVAAVRTRQGWDISTTAAPLECTNAAIAELTGDDRGTTKS